MTSFPNFGKLVGSGGGLQTASREARIYSLNLLWHYDTMVIHFRIRITKHVTCGFWENIPKSSLFWAKCCIRLWFKGRLSEPSLLAGWAQGSIPAGTFIVSIFFIFLSVFFAGFIVFITVFFNRCCCCVVVLCCVVRLSCLVVPRWLVTCLVLSCVMVVLWCRPFSCLLF